MVLDFYVQGIFLSFSTYQLILSSILVEIFVQMFCT